MEMSSLPKLSLPPLQKKSEVTRIEEKTGQDSDPKDQLLNPRSPLNDTRKNTFSNSMFQSNDHRDLADSMDAYITHKSRTKRCMYEFNTRYIIDVESTFSWIWSGLILALIAASAVYVPLEVVGWVQDSDWFRIVDAVFVLDIIINFNTSFKRGPLNASRRSQIAWNYASSWLLVDILASVSYPTSSCAPRCNIAKLLRFCRLFRVGRMLKRFTIRLKLKSIVVDTAKFFFIVVMMAHTFACTFLWLHYSYHVKRQASWVLAKWSSDWVLISRGDMYLHSLCAFSFLFSSLSFATVRFALFFCACVCVCV